MSLMAHLSPRLRGLSLLILAATIGSCLAGLASAQQFVERVYRDADGEHKYQVFVPAGYRPNRPSPAILFLHGAGERGTDGRLPTMVGLGPYAKTRGSSFPFLVVFPQAEDTSGRLLTPWTAGEPDAERALKILAEVQQTYTLNPERIALVGWSMGGYGAWSLGAAHPDKWSAVAALVAMAVGFAQHARADSLSFGGIPLNNVQILQIENGQIHFFNQGGIEVKRPLVDPNNPDNRLR